MVTYIEGNIFSSPAQVIVNTVNTLAYGCRPDAGASETGRNRRLASRPCAGHVLRWSVRRFEARSGNSPLSAGKGRRAFSFSFADTPEKRDYALRYNRCNQPLTLEANFVFEWLRGSATVSTSFADVRSVRAAAFLV